MIWTSDRVSLALGTVSEKESSFSEISTDTRSMSPGELFVALSGDNFDGHEYLMQAAKAGATGAVVRHGTPPTSGLQYFEVDDPLAALGKLANARRGMLTGPVIAITGTNGKTSTREMLRAVLGTRWKTHATRDNQNNLIGVPLTLLSAPEDTEAVVIEAGANELGEIARLRTVIEPTAAIVTNVSQGHLEGFGSLEAVMAEKMELVKDVPVAVTGVVPANLPGEAKLRVAMSCSAGLESPAEVTPSKWSLDEHGRVTMTFRGHRGTVAPPGRHQGDNAMLALALGEALGLEAARMVGSLAHVELPAGRSTLIKRGQLLILDDTYNANPGSVMASLDLVQSLRNGRPLVLVLGSMLELGTESARLHSDVVEEVLERTPDLIVGCGDFVAAFASRKLSADLFVAAEDVGDVARILNERLNGNELVLLKASRGIQLDRVIPLIAPTQGD